MPLVMRLAHLPRSCVPTTHAGPNSAYRPLQPLQPLNVFLQGLTVFENNGIYRGGDVGMHFLSILHPHGPKP